MTKCSKFFFFLCPKPCFRQSHLFRAKVKGWLIQFCRPMIDWKLEAGGLTWKRHKKWMLGSKKSRKVKWLLLLFMSFMERKDFDCDCLELQSCLKNTSKSKMTCLTQFDFRFLDCFMGSFIDELVSSYLRVLVWFFRLKHLKNKVSRVKQLTTLIFWAP